MKPTEKTEVLKLLAGLSEVYDKPLSEMALDIYWNALKEYSLDEVKRAVNNIVQTHKYATFPKPAEFIEFICPPEDAEMRAELAMGEFWERFEDGGYHNFEWKDPVLAMTVEQYGGWRMILDTIPRDDQKDLGFWLKDFKKVYQIFLKHPMRTVNTKYVGSFEADNRAKGYLTDERGEAIPLPGSEDFIMINSPEAKKYLEDKSNMLVPVGERIGRNRTEKK